MANMIKVSLYRVAAQIKHNHRTVQEDTNTIDYRLSGQNLYMTPTGEAGGVGFDFLGTAQAMIREAKKTSRRDLKGLVEWVITLPQDVKTEDQTQFFRACQSFVASRYGPSNMVGCFVHYDEPGARPHCHIDFVPRVANMVQDPAAKKAIYEARDKTLMEYRQHCEVNNVGLQTMQAKIKEIKADYKKRIKALPKINDGLKISAKDLMTIKDLTTFHPDLQKSVDKVMGYHVTLISGKTRTQGGNKTRGAYALEQAQRATQAAAENGRLFFYAWCKEYGERHGLDLSNQADIQKCITAAYDSARRLGSTKLQYYSYLRAIIQAAEKQWQNRKRAKPSPTKHEGATR